MLPQTTTPTRADARVTPARPEPVVGSTPGRRPSVVSIVARLLGVLLAMAGSSLLVFVHLGSFAVMLVALGAVAFIATLLIRSSWALLVVPVANTAGFVGTFSVVILFEDFTHGGDIQNPGELALAFIYLVFVLGALPALVGAVIGVLAWRGWGRWRDR